MFHSCNEPHYTPNPTNGHFEKEDLTNEGEFKTKKLFWICLNWSPLKSSKLSSPPSLNKCLAKKDLLAFKKMVDVLASSKSQLNSSLINFFTFVHSLSTPTIYNRVELMQTKVIHNFWNGLKPMHNVINLTFTKVDIERRGIAKLASEGWIRRSKNDLSFC